jgi:hypothetical protein
MSLEFNLEERPSQPSIMFKTLKGDKDSLGKSIHEFPRIANHGIADEQDFRSGQ